MKDYYIYTEQMTVGYGGKPLIRNINLHLRRGEILTLIGPNGSGKSTILKSIIQQLSLLGGAVYLDGRSMARMPELEVAKRLSVLMTERIRPELMTCEDVVSTGRYPYTGRLGILTAEDRRIVRESMALVHSEDLADCDFSEISDGQRQRILLARALCQEPEVIVLDEPTSFLDIRHKLELLSTLKDMVRQRQLAVVMSLHELDLPRRCPTMWSVCTTMPSSAMDRRRRFSPRITSWSSTAPPEAATMRILVAWRWSLPGESRRFSSLAEAGAGFLCTGSSSGGAFPLRQGFCRKTMWITRWQRPWQWRL